MVVDICFIMDMIIMFRTAYIDEFGMECDDLKKISENYLRGRFTIDFLSTIPFDQVMDIFLEEATARRFALLGVLKMVRVLRLNKIILYLNVK